MLTLSEVPIMKRFGLIIITVAVILSVFTVSAFADTYDYNDVLFYVNGEYWFTGSLTSDSLITNTIWFDFARDIDNGHLIYKAQGGSWHDSGHFYPNVNTVEGTQDSYNDVNIAYITSGSNPYFHVSNITPPNLSNDVYIYITTVQSKLTTPSVSFNSTSGYISWNSVSGAVSYTVAYRPSGSAQYNEILTTTQNNYYITTSGYYSVRANASAQMYNSDFSNGINVTYNPDAGGDEGPINWIISKLQTFVFNIKAFFGAVTELTNEIGNVFSNLTSFMPSEYAATIWSLAGLMLIFGIFRLF